MSVDYSEGAVMERLRQVSALTEFRTEFRLHGKIDYSPEGVERRLLEVQRALEACRALGLTEKV